MALLPDKLYCGDKGKNNIISLTFWERIVPFCLDDWQVAILSVTTFKTSSLLNKAFSSLSDTDFFHQLQVLTYYSTRNLLQFIQLRTRMEKYLKLDLAPSKPVVADTWSHWKMTLNIFLKAVCETPQPTSMTDRLKLKLQIHLLSPAIYKHISDFHDYVKPKNSFFCRHLLATRRQQTDESVDQYLQSWKRLAKDCNFQAVTATQASDEYIRGAFINGIASNHIRQRLLENKTLHLNTAYDQTLTLEMVQRQLAPYSPLDSLTDSVSTVRTEETDDCISVCDE